MADEMPPEEEAAARKGFLGNPIAVAYALAQPDGPGAPLAPGAHLQIPGHPLLACEWADALGVIRVHYESNWQTVDLGALGGNAGKLITEWAAIPGTSLEIRGASDPSTMAPDEFVWRVRIRSERTGVDPS